MLEAITTALGFGGIKTTTQNRLSKFAGILLPITVGVVGTIYTVHKDESDNESRAQANAQQVAQAQYANFGLPLPLFTSTDDRQVSAGLDIYNLEAAVGRAPQNLEPLLQQIGAAKPQILAQTQAAEQAGSVQAGNGCKVFPSGLFIQVANDQLQLKDGQPLATLLKSEAGLPPVQEVQMVDALPPQTQLRYYFSSVNDPQAAKVIDALKRLGFSGVAKQDLSPTYLKNKNCSPPPTFELWMGAGNPLDTQGLPHGLTTPSAN